MYVSALLKFLDSVRGSKGLQGQFPLDLSPSSFATIRRTIGFLAPSFGMPDTDDNSLNALAIQGLLVTLQARFSTE